MGIVLPEIADREVGDVLAVVEVDFEDKGTRFCEGRDGLVCNIFDVAKFDTSEEGAVCGESQEAIVC